MMRGSKEYDTVPTAISLLGVFALHAAVDPGLWRAYVASLGQQAGSANDAPFVGEQLLFLVPSTLGDFVLRFVIGLLLVAVAVRYRWDWLAFAAAALAVPTLWTARLAALVGVPRLVVDRPTEVNRREDGVASPDAK